MKKKILSVNSERKNCVKLFPNGEFEVRNSSVKRKLEKTENMMFKFFVELKY